jgi:hypothetical protein
MRPAHALAVVTLAALLSVFAGSGFGAEGGNGAGAKRGNAAEHARERGRHNTNTQWTADPDRGWVRAEDRQGRERGDSPERGKHKNGHPKGKGKSRKS